ncbi:MAG: SgcJ/EcaC family oxidoreductase [Bacteroidetes bacterium]|nr:SgcJ/EcaC family oxidoreductase [Bacteroidota bacterium]
MEIYPDQQNDETAVRLLYIKLLACWNNHDAQQYSELFADDANVIGFDGSQMNGKEQIRKELSRIFKDHKPAAYINIIKEIRPLTPEVTLLRAVVGMLPPGKSDINPEVNAIQTMIAQKQNETFVIALFHNTPAAFHGHPELREKLSEELREVLLAQKHA